MKKKWYSLVLQLRKASSNVCQLDWSTYYRWKRDIVRENSFEQTLHELRDRQDKRQGRVISPYQYRLNIFMLILYFVYVYTLYISVHGLSVCKFRQRNVSLRVSTIYIEQFFFFLHNSLIQKLIWTHFFWDREPKKKKCFIKETKYGN